MVMVNLLFALKFVNKSKNHFSLFLKLKKILMTKVIIAKKLWTLKKKKQTCGIRVKVIS